MKCVASLRLIRNAVVAFAALLAVSVTSSAARGECGDYVIVGQPLLNSSNLSLEHRLKFAIQSMYAHNGQTDRHGSMPCHGPSCSRRDRVPTSPAPTAVVMPNPTDWAFLVTCIPLLEFGPERFSPLSIASLPERRSSPLEHPPRAA
jgi:hypothetical protein